MVEGILQSVADFLGVVLDDYKNDLIVAINRSFNGLSQLGVGPELGFTITGDGEKWTDFLSDKKFLASCQTYIFIRTKLIFDPPASSTLINEYKEQLKELEFYLNTVEKLK